MFLLYLAYSIFLALFLKSELAKIQLSVSYRKLVAIFLITKNYYKFVIGYNNP
ncbi:hypothetical protein T190607A02C_250008 [Tenacibaculum sp. 190524A02b]